MSNVKRLVQAIVQFLGDQLQSNELTVDAKESLEVAIQCLETAYGVTPRNSPTTPGPSLLEIFGATENVSSAPPPGIPSEEAQVEAEKLKNQGNQLMKTEQHQEALECYTRAIQLDGRNSIYFCNRAAAFSKLNDHQLAIEDCQLAIQMDPTYSKAYGRMGLAYASLGEHQKAKECYLRALDLDPTNESYSNNLKVAEDKILEQQTGSDPSGGMPRGGGGMDFSSLFANPALVNMATQLMQDSNMRNMMAGLMSNSLGSGVSAGTGTTPTGEVPTAPPQPGGGMDALLQAGQQLAAQMQASNPDLVDQLRRQMNLQPPGSGGSSESDNNNQPRPGYS